MNHHISIRRLGVFDAQVGEVDSSPALGRKTAALLTYLAATRRPHRRQALADLFCQTANDPAGALRWHLSRLRKALGSDVIQANGEQVRFELRAGWLDLDQFERVLDGDLAAWDAEALTAAVTLYRGEFLAGLSLADAAEFELWLLAERARLRALYERGLAELVERCIAAGRHLQAMEYAQQLLHSDPLHEETHARLIWLYAVSGRRDAALQQFELCRTLLHDELGVNPLSETQALHEQVLVGKLTPVPARFTPTPEPALAVPQPPADFVGREIELTQLHRPWQAACQGQGTVALVEAEAGGGKTRLMQEFAATMLDGLFLASHCYESERTLPYRPWIDLLEAHVAGLDSLVLERLHPFWCRQLVRLLPALARDALAAWPTAGGELEHLFTAMAELLLHLPDTLPRLVFETTCSGPTR